MKNVMAIVLVLLSCSSQARDTALFLSIDDAMTTVDAKQRLNQGIKFVFGENVVNAKSTYGTFVSNKKTNAFNKSDQQACNWVFLSSILALQKRALAEGGDAVVDIHSYYKKREHHSREEFECHTGAIMAGVALRGTVVKLTK